MAWFWLFQLFRFPFVALFLFMMTLLHKVDEKWWKNSWSNIFKEKIWKGWFASGWKHISNRMPIWFCLSEFQFQWAIKKYFEKLFNQFDKKRSKVLLGKIKWKVKIVQVKCIWNTLQCGKKNDKCTVLEANLYVKAPRTPKSQNNFHRPLKY